MALSTDYDLDVMLTQATEARASDLHIRVGMPPMIRVDGSLMPLPGYGSVSKDKSADIVVKSTTEAQKKDFYENHSLSFSKAITDVARFRCSYFLQQRLMSMVYRRIPDNIPSLADIRAPAIFLQWARLPRGLILVTGPTGSGKSTTLAAMLDLINTERSDHILTIEDPIEFVHKPKRCVVNQREIGSDAPNFSFALRDALRQDPDVILVGEMRDLETIATAITAAETGHLVFGTLHTSTAESTISRVIDQYPADQQQQIRVMLAASLVGVVTQTLLPRADGPGRIACHEVMVCNNAVRACIRHQQMDQVRGIMQTQNKIGMQTMDRCLSYYVHQGLISEDMARERAVNVEEFDQTLTSFRTGRDVAIPQIVHEGQGQMLSGMTGGATPMALPPSSASIDSGAAPARAPAAMPMAPPLPAFAGENESFESGADTDTQRFEGGFEGLPAAVPGEGGVDLAAAARAAALSDAALRAARAAAPPASAELPASPPLPPGAEPAEAGAEPVAGGVGGTIRVPQSMAPPLPPGNGSAPLTEVEDSTDGAAPSRFSHLFEDKKAWVEDEDNEPPRVD